MLKCVIFDLDNTLVESDLDFAAIHAEIGTEQPILEYRATADETEKQRIDAILERHEDRAATGCVLLPGARELLEMLRARRLRTALLTRNSRRSVEIVLKRHCLHFDIIVTRDDGVPKPSPEPVLTICRNVGVSPVDTLVIGDYLYDIQCGQAAGTRTMLLDGPNRKRFVAQPDYEVASLGEAQALIEEIMQKENAL